MRTVLLPKEHGAYGQMAFPLVTALIVSGITASAALTAVAIVTGFLAHEPALVLLGMRGPRARRERSRPAVVWLSVLGTVTVAAGLAAIQLAPQHVLWSFALPLLPAALLVIAIATGQEKSWHAEIAVALTFSVAAVPLCLASGSGTSRALGVAIPFAVIFIAGTLAVRTVVLRVRGGGDRRAVAATRVAVVAFTIAAAGVLIFAARSALLPWEVPIAVLPGLALSVGVSVSSVPARRLKSIGWALVAASTTAAIIIITAM